MNESASPELGQDKADEALQPASGISQYRLAANLMSFLWAAEM